MQSSQVLDVFEGLLLASQHPDIAKVERYGHDAAPGGGSPAGVAVTYGSGSTGYLWATVGTPEPKPHPLGDELPSFRFRAAHLLKLVIALLDAARPEPFTSWQPCAFNGVELKPSGVKVTCRDGSAAYLRVTSGSGPTGDPVEDPHPDYQIPEGVKEWHLRVSAAHAAHG